MRRASDSTLKDRVKAARAEKDAVRASLKAVLVNAERERAESKIAARAAMSPVDRAIADSYKKPRARAPPPARAAELAPSRSSSYECARAAFWAADDAPEASGAADAPAAAPSRSGGALAPPRPSGGDMTAAFSRKAPPATVREVHRILDEQTVRK